MTFQGYGEQSSELDAWMAERHDPNFKPTKTRRLPVRTQPRALDYSPRRFWREQGARARRLS